jgi:hypothetical protein
MQLVVVYRPHSFIHSFIHYVVFLTTGPFPLSKRAVRRMRSGASAFNSRYLLISSRSCRSCLHLLPRLLSFLQYYVGLIPNVFALTDKNIDNPFKCILCDADVCFDFLYNFCLKNFLFWEELSEIRLKMYIFLHVKYPLFLSYFNETWIFSTNFGNMLKYQFSRKSVHWEPSFLVRTDGQPTMTKL